MANYDDYQLYDDEDQAMKNSQMAKRVALGAAGVAAGGAAAFAATQLAGDNNDSDLTAQDIEGGLEAGEITDDVLDPVVTSAPATAHVDEVHVYHHVVDEPQVDPEVEFTDTHVLVDDDGNILASMDEGTIDGKDFYILDEDGDGVADEMGYDVNGNHVYEEDEVARLGDDVHITTGNSDNIHVHYTDDVYVDDDIHNDYNDKDDDEYGRDLADNNDDYNNHADVEHYAAGDEYNDEYQGDYDGLQQDSLAIADEEYIDPIDMSGDDMAMTDDFVADDFSDTLA